MATALDDAIDSQNASLTLASVVTSTRETVPAVSIGAFGTHQNLPKQGSA